MVDEKKDETSESSEEKSEETKEDAKSEESTEETKEESTEETKDEVTDTKIDYKAKHEEEKERRLAAEKALADDRYKADEARRKAEEATSDEEVEDKPLTKADFAEERAKDRQIMLKEARSVETQSIVKGMTNDVDEQNYVLEIHKNRTFPENLSLKEQLEEAHAIANKDKWKGERDEALRKAKGDQGANTDGASAHRKPPESKAGEPSMSAEDKQLLVSKGWKWNTTNKRHEKTTASGVELFRDPKTGAVKTAKK